MIEGVLTTLHERRVLTPSSPYRQNCLAGSECSGGQEAGFVLSLAAKEARDLCLCFGEMKIEQTLEARTLQHIGTAMCIHTDTGIRAATSHMDLVRLA